MAFSGFADATVYTLTRRHMVLDANPSRSGQIYAYTDSVCETHISSMAPQIKESKKGFLSGSRFRRGLGAALGTVEDDGEGSTDGIVRNDDLELNDMPRGVYQETTIEISHEPAQTAEHGHHT